MKNLDLKQLPLLGILIFNLTAHNLSYAQAGKSKCKRGQHYDNSLNRCVTDSKVISTRTETLNCKGLEGDAFKKCFDNNVNKSLQEGESEGKIKGKTDPSSSLIVPGLVVIGAGVVLLNKKDVLGNCSSMSTWLMLGGGVATILGEMMAQKSYKKKLDGMIERYHKQMQENPLNEEESIDVITQNQKIAYDFQIEQEKARKSAHESRQKTYMLAFGLYTASSLAAIYEAMTTTGGTECAASSFDQNPNKKINTLFVADTELYQKSYFIEDLTAAELRELVIRKISGLFIEPVFAAETAGSGDGASSFSMPKSFSDASSAAGDFIKPAFDSPWKRAVISGVLAAYSLMVANKAGELAKEAEERIKFLQELRDDFLANGGARTGNCSAKDRDDNTKPECYCYVSGGAPNRKRANYPTCQRALADTNYDASNYDPAYAKSNYENKGCFTQTKRFDPKCACKKDKDKKGKDRCLRLDGKLKLGDMGKLNGLKDMMKDTVNFTNGNLSTGELDQAGLKDLALRVNKVKDKLAKNPKYAANMLKLKEAQGRIQKQIAAKMQRGLASGELSSPFNGGMFGGGSPSNAQDVLKDLKEKIDAKRGIPQFKRGKSLAATKTKRGMSDFNFGDSGSGQAGVNVEDLNKVMNKDFAYNDINENPGHSIFQIITLRYQRSGLRRLFDEKGKTQADAANTTDINER